jgi:hypothetical protein
MGESKSLTDMLISMLKGKNAGLELTIFLGFISGFVEEKLGADEAKIMFEQAYITATELRRTIN